MVAVGFAEVVKVADDENAEASAWAPVVLTCHSYDFALASVPPAMVCEDVAE
jgi:hypothetical protein